MQAGVLGRVAVADDDAPVVLADAQRLAVADAAVAVGQRVDELAELAEAGAAVLDRGFAPAGAAVEADRVSWGLAPGVGRQYAADQVLQLGHPRRQSNLRVSQPAMPT